nr:hypothetical protein [Gilliamella apicola]
MKKSSFKVKPYCSILPFIQLEKSRPTPRKRCNCFALTVCCNLPFNCVSVTGTKLLKSVISITPNVSKNPSFS